MEISIPYLDPPLTNFLINVLCISSRRIGSFLIIFKMTLPWIGNFPPFLTISTLTAPQVLVSGTPGGVGSVATLLLSQLGYHVVAVTGPTKSQVIDLVSNFQVCSIIALNITLCQLCPCPHLTLITPCRRTLTTSRAWGRRSSWTETACRGSPSRWPGRLTPAVWTVRGGRS